MKSYSIKTKLLLVFAALLTIVTLLNALQTSYVINRRGEEEAFAQLSHQLTLFQRELRDLRETQIAVALDGARDDKNLSDLAILYTQTLKFRQQSGTALERTLSLNKATSLNRLQLILDSARLSSASVYLDGALSHYITRDEAGMASLHDGREVLVGAGRNEGENEQLANWRAWQETEAPVLVTPYAPVVDRVTVAFEFPAEALMVLRVIVPVQGVLRESFMETIVEHMAIAAPETRRSSQSGGRTPRVIGMFGFSQAFDTAFLQDITHRTGMAPAIFSTDGQHALQLKEMGSLPPALPAGPAHGSILSRTIAHGGTSYYQAFKAWRIDGEPALILGGTLSREGTLAMIRQTIISITGTTLLIFLVMGTFGYLVLTRMVAPIKTLTAAVSGIGLNRARELEPAMRETTLHIALGRYLDCRISPQSRGEIGALTCAFNSMAGQLHDLIGSLETQVRERTAQLETANKELDAFAYSVSHDLKAPLRHIDGYMELLEKKTGTTLDEKSRHYMGAISEAAKKMGLLIDDLLSFSRMGRQAMSFQSVDLGTLVRDVIRELEPDAAGRNIDWSIGDLPAVGGDASMLRMVLVNLLANAIKYTRPRQQARIEIGSVPGQDSETVISVRDNGAGFDMAYVDNLFGVFQRLHRADGFEGTGIGLANVRRIIVRHGGRTWAEGEIDRGATFFFSLPRKQQGGNHANH